MKINSILLTKLLFILILFLTFQNFSSAQFNQGNEIRDVLKKFKEGVEKGDKSIGPQIATEKFSSFFVPFYNQLAEGYSQAKIPFPMEIGQLKILSNGKAKVETYINPAKNLFVFTLEKENDQWKLCHWENIRFPLYSIPSIPYEEILELPEQQRGWMLAERDMAFRCRVFDKLKNSIDEKTAKGFFLDGPGYQVAMDAWLPFVEGAAQFALFFNILEKNYYGANYSIENATEAEAKIHCKPLIELDVLKRAYFYPKMTIEEYKQFYTSIMESRAKACGLDIIINFDDINCVINLKKKEKINK